jgi:hypothetical protein
MRKPQHRLLRVGGRITECAEVFKILTHLRDWTRSRGIAYRNAGDWNAGDDQS